MIAVYPGGMRTDLFNEDMPKNYNEFMNPDYVADKIVENLKKNIPEDELIIRRQSQY